MTDTVTTEQPAQPSSLQEPAATQPVEPSPREKFLSMLPENMRTEGAFGNFNSIDDLAKSYLNAAKLVGLDKGSVVAIPKDDDPEAWAAVYDKLGRPQDPKGYEYETFKDAIPPEVLGKYAEIMHKGGVSKAAFNNIVSELVRESAHGEELVKQQTQQQVQKWQQEVKAEFGAAYEDKLALARSAVERFGLTDVVKENVEFFENPALIKALVAIGEKTAEGTVLTNGQTSSTGRLSPNEARAEIAKLESEHRAAIIDPKHPQHEFIKSRRSELFKYAYPE